MAETPIGGNGLFFDNIIDKQFLYIELYDFLNPLHSNLKKWQKTLFIWSMVNNDA